MVVTIGMTLLRAISLVYICHPITSGIYDHFQSLTTGLGGLRESIAAYGDREVRHNTLSTSRKLMFFMTEVFASILVRRYISMLKLTSGTEMILKF